MAETRLARALGVSTAPLEPAKVAEALPPHSALIDLSRYIHVQTSWPSEVRYVAFVTCAGGPSRRVELGPAGPIDQAVTAWRESIRSGSVPDAGELVRRLWQPLEPRLDGVTTVLVAPDGGLNFLPFGALADPAKPGGFLVERYAFGTVGSARYLVEMPRAAAGSEVESLLAVGGVDYESSVSGQNSPPPPGFPGPTVTVDPLPAHAPKCRRSAVFSTASPTASPSRSPAGKLRRNIFAPASPGIAICTWPLTVISSRRAPDRPQRPPILKLHGKLPARWEAHRAEGPRTPNAGSPDWLVGLLRIRASHEPRRGPGRFGFFDAEALTIDPLTEVASLVPGPALGFGLRRRQ